MKRANHRLTISIQYDDLTPKIRTVSAPGHLLLGLNQTIEAAIDLARGFDGCIPEQAYEGECVRCGGAGCSWCDGTGKSGIVKIFEGGEQ